MPYFPSKQASETALSILTKLLTVDGSGSGLDADTLDGLHASEITGITDHGALTGLSDNDHPQYYLASNVSSYAATLLLSANAAAARSTLGLSSMAVATESNYLLVDGTRNSTGIQQFTAGMKTGIIRAINDSTSAILLKNASGGDVGVLDTTNGRLQIVGNNTQLRVSTTSLAENAYFSVSAGGVAFYTTNDIPFTIATNNLNTLILRAGASNNAAIIRGASSQTGAFFRVETSGQEELFSVRPISSSNQRAKLSIYNTLQVAGTPTNYERLVLYPDNTNSIFIIDSEAGGTGVRRGLRIAGSALSFYDSVTPVSRQLLATGTGATVDDVISKLQLLGLLRQS